jgi:tetratricopeptide (TPR) repeat protein
MEWERSLLDWTANPMIRAKGASIWLMPVEMLGRYVQLLIVPWKLSIDYGGRVIGWVVHPGDPYLYIGIAAIVLWIALMGVALWRRWGMAAFCLLIMALTWGMVSNFGVLIGTNFAERLMFLPSAFFLILLSMGLAKLPRPVLAPVLAALLALGALRSVTYARQWNNRLGFYEYSLRNQPTSVRIHLLVATELEENGDYEQADRVLEQARKSDPDYWAVWGVSCDIALKQHHLDEAQRYLDHGWKIAPNPTVLWERREKLEKLQKMLKK